MPRSLLCLARQLLLAAFALGLAPAMAEPMKPADLPKALQDWLPWALHGHEAQRCPVQHDNADAERECVWPSLLDLRATASGASFRLEVQVFGPTTRVRLPGEVGAWPQDVRSAGRAVAVVAENDLPTVLLAPGRHVIEGRLGWREQPQDLQLPPGVATLAFWLDGQAVQRQADAQGRLWLREAADAEAPAGDSLSLRTVRRVEDGIPMSMTTQVSLVLAGKPREVVLPLAVLPGWQASAIRSPLPVRLQDDGRLIVQGRPGTWALEVDSRSLKPLQQLALPEGGATPFELWAFAARNELRVVTVTGASTVDPRQVEMPADWRGLPAWRLKGGEALKFQETRRGTPEAEADALRLQRQLWLDFDGGGYTAQDRISGRFSRSTRLTMPEPSLLGRADVNGQDQLITRVDGQSGQGFELRQTQGQVKADSRINGPLRTLPATGWAMDVESAGVSLHLPPGWQLLHAGGVDQAGGSWLSNWTLWDVFFLLLATAAAGRLLGWRVGAVLGVALLLARQLDAAPPTWLWLLLLGLMALGHALLGGDGTPASARRARAANWVDRLRWACAGLLVLALLPFAVAQVRLAIYPSLELPWQQADAVSTQGAPQGAPFGSTSRLNDEAAPFQAPAEVAATAEAPSLMVPEAPAPSSRGRMAAISESKLAAPAQKLGQAYGMSRQINEPDPRARVQTGPGLPKWTWRLHNLSWQGPVKADQTVSLWLLPPWATAAWRVLSVLLLGAALWLLCRPGKGGGFVAGKGWLGAAVLATAAVTPTAQAAEVGWPTDDQLTQLRERVNAAPDCLPACVSVARAVLSGDGNRLQLRLELHAQSPVAAPLPGQGTNWRPSRVWLEGAGAAPAATLRDGNGALWVAVPEGVSQVLLEADVAQADAVDISLPLPVRELRTALQGWSLSGLDARGLPAEALNLARDASSTQRSSARGSDATTGIAKQSDQLPPLVRVERHLRLGLQWTVETRIQRLSDSRAPVRVQYALLAGESVTDASVQVENGIASVQLAAEGERLVNSALKVQPQLSLQASTAAHQVELWTLNASGQWRASWKGIAPIQHAIDGNWAPQWQPWPGERVDLTLQKPAGVEGQTLTLDWVRTVLSPGQRATDGQAQLMLRTSLGGDHLLQLPPGAELLSVKLGEQALPIQLQNGKLRLPLTPGAHRVALSWRQPEGISTLYRSAPLGLNLPGVNDALTLTLPKDRVTLLVGGPVVGPAVLLWGLLLVMVAAAALLRKLPGWPLGIAAGSLLALGLAPASLAGVAIVAGWFLLIRQRAALAHSIATWSHRRHNALQLLIGLWTVAAVLALLEALRVGLLGHPNLLIQGNGSQAHMLNWFADRLNGDTHSAWVLSAPMWAYRLLMLVWALWLANALLGWVRWAWGAFQAGGLWRAKPPKQQPPPAPSAPSATSTAEGTHPL